ncbi:MAG: hypothetical protein A2666_03060 [Parcubacteria group bacterium RIFCSPHIGHO2_01_FULL_47_10b]|nr:MAG: hypothetical protein A2666_03060 [Parcubacteria group bacterium RIFCSPHIGHO2_01_FULL_47_10b]
MEKISIRVTGKVQGVFFRHESRKIAETLDITGFVRNEPDGSVFIEAEGEREALLKLLLFTKTGPRYAKVERVEPLWGVGAGGHKSFSIQ